MPDPLGIAVTLLLQAGCPSVITNSIKALKATVCIQNYLYTGGGILAFLK